MLDNIDTKDTNGDYVWKEYYNSLGDWYYPLEDEHSAKWSPNLSKEGCYKIHVIVHKDQDQSNVNYSIYVSELEAEPIATISVNQAGDGWDSINLKKQDDLTSLFQKAFFCP